MSYLKQTLNQETQDTRPANIPGITGKVTEFVKSDKGIGLIFGILVIIAIVVIILKKKS